MTHSSEGRFVWSSRSIVGIDTFSTVLSSTTMNAERMAMTRVTQRVGSGSTSSVTGLTIRVDFSVEFGRPGHVRRGGSVGLMSPRCGVEGAGGDNKVDKYEIST